MRHLMLVVLLMSKYLRRFAQFSVLFSFCMSFNSKWNIFEEIGYNDSPVLIVEKNKGKVIVKSNNIILSEYKIDGDESVYILDDIVYRLCMAALIKESIIHLHSSFVLYNEQAILFTGPSGIGKTTQAELWRDYEDAIIVNGDVTLIRKIDDVWRAFGAPIHGSSPYCENMDAPIAAIIVLKQAEENQLIRLDAFTALGECFPEIYRPEMSDETYEILLDTVDALFSEIPVYQLSCRPDRESVELVKQTLFDQNPEL